jgi:hypothetical protein
MDIVSCVNNTLNQPTSQSTILVAALAWLARGVPLVPVQPGQKRQVAGFGAHCLKVTTLVEAEFWFGERHANLAIITGIGDVVALDFDSWGDFARFADRHPDLTETLTEQSRRGVHLYYKIAEAGRVRSCTSAEECEVKAAGGTVLVAPSVVGGIRYTTVTLAPILRCDDLLERLRLSLLSESQPSRLEEKGATNTVARCKAALDILGLAQDLQRLRGLPVVWTHSPDGAWWRSCCPFHGPEKNASFQVNTAKGFYLCRACGERGDAIDLYQVLHQLSDVQSAIASVARGLVSP